MGDRSSPEKLFAPSTLTLEGANADIYFQRGKQVLEAEDENPTVVAEVFARQPSMLSGMREVHALLREVLPARSEAWSLKEGSRFSSGDVVLRIKAPYRNFCVFETAILGILASGTGWAGAADDVVQAAGEIPVVCFGARHVHPDVSGRMEYAACLAGCAGCATMWGAQLAGVDPSGTLPHGLILAMGDTLVAAAEFDRVIDPEVKRIVLVDTFRDEAEESLRVAEALGKRLWGVRLDTPSERGGVTSGLVKEVRARLDQAGYDAVKIVVSGGLDVERICSFRKAGAPVDMFGVGSAISAAPPVDFTMDVKEIDGRPIAKRGRIPGVTEITRLEPLAL